MDNAGKQMFDALKAVREDGYCLVEFSFERPAIEKEPEVDEPDVWKKYEPGNQLNVRLRFERDGGVREKGLAEILLGPAYNKKGRRLR